MDKKSKIFVRGKVGFAFVILYVSLVALLLFNPILEVFSRYYLFLLYVFVLRGNLFIFFSGGLATLRLLFRWCFRTIIFKSDFLFSPPRNRGVMERAIKSYNQSSLWKWSFVWSRSWGIGTASWMAPKFQSDTIFSFAGKSSDFSYYFFFGREFALLSIIGYEVAKMLRNRFEMLVLCRNYRMDHLSHFCPIMSTWHSSAHWRDASPSFHPGSSPFSSFRPRAFAPD